MRNELKKHTHFITEKKFSFLYVIILIFSILFTFFYIEITHANDYESSYDLGLTSQFYKEGVIPDGWKLKKVPGYTTNRVSTKWVINEGKHAVELQSDSSLTFLQKNVSIDIKNYPIVTWSWKVENILESNNERTKKGDDHPIRIFFVFEPDVSQQTLGFRIKRFLFLDAIHGHPMGGRFTEYLWSSHLPVGDIINDPSKPKQKLMVIEGGNENVGKWLTYKRNLYEDFKNLYNEEPRKLIFIGILNDTDQTGQKATSYIVDLMLHQE
jgi:hypothetical protein